MGMIKSSYNQCINIWEEYSNTKSFDLYIVFPEYMTDNPIENALFDILEEVFKKSVKTQNANKETIVKNIKNALETNNVEYIEILCKEKLT